MSDERPSIAELIAAADDAIGGTISERLDARDRIVTAAPVLLEIVAAAKALEPELVYLQGPLSERLRDVLGKVRQ